MTYEAFSERVSAYIKHYGSINNTECRQLLDVDRSHATYLLDKMTSQNLLARKGTRRWARYYAPAGEST